MRPIQSNNNSSSQSALAARSPLRSVADPARAAISPPIAIPARVATCSEAVIPACAGMTAVVGMEPAA